MRQITKHCFDHRLPTASTCRNTLILLAVSFANSVLLHAEAPPNVLLIVVDDLNDWVSCMGGHPQARTPNIDRLASKGVLFTNAHCQAPICGPSRASWLSGRYPHTTGVYQQPKKDSLAKDNENFRGRLLPEYFAEHGYQTLGVGKITHGYPGKIAFEDYGGRFNGFGPYPPGRKRFNYFLPDVPWSGTLTDWGMFPENDAELSDPQAASWAEDNLMREFDKPFLMGVGFVRPHVPFYVPQEWFDRFPLDEIKLPPVRLDDMNDIPAIGRAIHEMPKYPRLEFLRRDHDLQFKKCVQAYLACVAFVDFQIGRVLNALERSPHRTNTIVVFLSDHGYHLGEKDRVSKHTLWEEATHVPLCFADFRPEAERRVACDQQTDLPVGLVDIFPTLTRLCGIPHQPTNEGVSLTEVLRNPRSAQIGRTGILTTYARRCHAIRTSRFRYIQYEDGSEELYDHESDPQEWDNRADDPRLERMISDLRKLLPESNAEYHPSTSTKPINAWFQSHFSCEVEN